MGHGGFKQSGIGREGGVDGLLPFLESKAILLDGPTARYYQHTELLGEDRP
jgi:aldehyde dehydrogenase (NAD+)